MAWKRKIMGVLLLEFCVVSVTLPFALGLAQSTNIDSSTYEQGKKQFEVIQHQAELPRYGQCWKDAMVLMQTGCTRLTDDVQGRLALAYLNCFLNLQGREQYHCNPDQPLEECTKSIDNADRGSFTTFFTHTQNICYFLRAQVWNEATEQTISSLAQSSSHVASQLQVSSELQSEMIKQQNYSLKNQIILIENAENLTNVLTSSSEEINRLFDTFKETTQEQRLLITDVFQQLISLKQTVLGEFSGFYSILYYFFSVLVSYLLTSTTRTSGARFWLFSIVTASIFFEYLITAWASNLLPWTSVNSEDHDDWVHWTRSCCRKMFAAAGFLVLGLCAYRHCDINTANNQLLVEIRKQNSDLKRLLGGASALTPGLRPNNVHQLPGGITQREEDNGGAAATEDTNSVSGITETGSSLDSDSDRTYILRESETGVSETDSYMTAETLHGSSFPSVSAAGQESLLQELRELRSATPLKEMAGHMERWVDTGLYSRYCKDTAPEAAEPNASLGGSPYHLRPRRGRLANLTPPAAEVESPKSFAKTVRQLERIAEKNSRMVCAAVSRKRAK